MGDIQKTDTVRIWKDAQELRAKFETLVSKGRDPNKIKKNLEQEFEWLHSNFPKAFELCCNPSVKDLSKLQFMLTQIQRIQQGNSSEHDASSVVGKRLAEEYVYPKIDMSKEPDISFVDRSQN